MTPHDPSHPRLVATIMAEADSNEDIMTATPQNSLQLAHRGLLG
jgi:hypothetical protein